MNFSRESLCGLNGELLTANGPSPPPFDAASGILLSRKCNFRIPVWRRSFVRKLIFVLAVLLFLPELRSWSDDQLTAVCFNWLRRRSLFGLSTDSLEANQLKMAFDTDIFPKQNLGVVLP